MAATIPSTALVLVQPAFTESERLALAGYLAGRGIDQARHHQVGRMPRAMPSRATCRQTPSRAAFGASYAGIPVAARRLAAELMNTIAEPGSSTVSAATRKVRPGTDRERVVPLGGGRPGHPPP